MDGSEIWTITTDYLQHMIYENGKIYAFFANNYWGTDFIKLYEINPTSGFSVLLSTINSGVSPQRVVSMSFWNHPNGKDIIFVQANNQNSISTNLFAWDINNDSIYYKIPVGASSQPNTNHIIDGNNIYVNQGSQVSKFNLFTKNYDWIGQFSAHKPKNSIVKHNGFIYSSNGENEEIEKINDTNGYRTSGGISFGVNLGIEHKKGKHLKIINNTLLYSSKSVFSIFDLTSNSVSRIIKTKEYLNNKKVDIFIPSFDVDPVTNYIYTGYKGRLICIKEK